jgi:hypothetical protein
MGCSDRFGTESETCNYRLQPYIRNDVITMKHHYCQNKRFKGVYCKEHASPTLRNEDIEKTVSDWKKNAVQEWLDEK